MLRQKCSYKNDIETIDIEREKYFSWDILLTDQISFSDYL